MLVCVCCLEKDNSCKVHGATYICGIELPLLILGEVRNIVVCSSDNYSDAVLIIYSEAFYLWLHYLYTTIIIYVYLF